MPDYIPTDSLRDETIDDIIAFIQDGEIVTAPLELIRYKGMRGYVMLTNGPTSDGYLFNMDNGGKASATVEYNPYVVDYSSIPVSSTVPAQVSSQWQDTYATSVQGQSQTTQIESSKVAAALSAAGDPVNMVNGEYYQQEKPDIFVPSRGFNLAITRKYKSQLIYNGPFGYGWAWNHAERLMLLDNGDIKYYDNDCTAHEIKSNGDGTYQYPPGLIIRLENTGSGYTITMLKANIRLFFSDTGLLTRKEDAFGNTLTFLYDSNNNLTTIRDTLNRNLTFHYNSSNQKVERIEDFTGRSVRYDYDGDDLIAFTDLENNTTRFEYLKNQENELNNHNMSKCVLPNGDYLEIGYYKNDQVAFHRNKKDETFNFHYSRLNRYGETWNEEGYYRKVFFDENNNVVRIANEDRTIEQMTYDEYHNMISKTDANGYTTVFDYYPADGNPAIAADRNLYQVTNTMSETLQFRYDDPDNLYAPSQITDPVGRVTRFEYYPSGRLHRKIQARGYALDANWNLIENSGAPGSITEYIYDAHGNNTNITDANGHSIINAFDNDGLYLVSTTDKNGHTTHFDYYLPGNPESMPVGLLRSQTINTPLDPQGFTSYLEYNQYNQKTLEGNALGEEVEYRYDLNRQLTHVISANGATSENIYDSARDIVAGAKIIEAIDPMGHSVYFKHDKLGNVIEQTDKNGNTTRYAYDGLNRLIQETDPLGYTTAYEYDGTGNLVTLADKRGNRTVNAYDAAGRLIRNTDPEGHITNYSYYADGKLKQEVRTINNEVVPSTIETYHEYNALSQLVLKRISRKTGGQVVEQRTFQYRYDALGQLKKEIYPENNFVEYDYDGNGNLVRTTHYDRNGLRLKHIENIYYADSRNLLKQVIVDNGKDGSGAGNTYEYDAVGRTTAEIDPVGHRIEYDYDAVGNLTLISDPAGITQHFYDLLNRRIRTIDAVSAETVNLYDRNGNTVLSVDAERNETYTWFDAMNRMIGREDAAGALTTFNYDANGNLVDINDPNQGNTSFRYDRNNRRVKIIRPMTETVSYTYDGGGNLATVLDAKNQKITYEYGSFNQIVTARYYSAGNHATPLKTVTFNYDDNGNLTGYEDGITSAVYTYDDLNRKTGERVSYPSFDKSYAYAYPNHWQTTFTGPDATTLTFNYDAALRLTGIQIPDQGTISYSDHFWNAPTSVELPGGSTIEYHYDNLMRPELVSAHDAQQQPILSRNYIYSAAGNILEADTEDGLYSFEYNRLHRLEAATNPVPLQDERYTYDALGNRKIALHVGDEWVYNPNNELESYGDVELEYDDNGNLTSKTSPGIAITYSHDIENRLVEVSGGIIRIEYYYDPFGRRLWKEVAGQRIYYFYSDEGLIAEFGTGGEHHYGYLPASDWTTAPLYKKEGNSYYWYLNDHLGTPQKMIADSGQIVWSAKYDSFGNVVIETAAIYNNLRLPGQYFDSETGLYYNRHRYYDPNTGRYLRVDPAEDGLNLYVYVHNNPLIFIDPLGLTPHVGGNYFTIPSIPTYSYQGNAYDWVKAVDNAAINVANDAIGIVNTVLVAPQYAYQHGIVEWGKAEWQGAKNIVTGIGEGIVGGVQYHLNTPASQQLADTANVLSSPEA